MKLLLVNPNTTASMTEKAGEAARLVAASGTEIIAVKSGIWPRQYRRLLRRGVQYPRLA